MYCSEKIEQWPPFIFVPSSKMTSMSGISGIPRIRKQHTEISLDQLITDFRDGNPTIAPHQREYCWDLARQDKFIRSILSGYPVPSILMSKRREDAHPTLEDGRQRLTTALRFRDDKFKVGGTEGKFYSELSVAERLQFDNERIMVITFSNASDDDRIQIFDWHQNGAPLSPGERCHAQQSTPLIALVKAMLMTPGVGYHDRAERIWGVRGDPAELEGPSKDKRRRWLMNAVALVLGLLYGPGNATKKYEYIVSKHFMTARIPATKEADVRKDFERILEIYEAVETAQPMGRKKLKNPQWDLGTFTGYILYSLSILARQQHDLALQDFSPEEQTPFEEVYEPNSLEGQDEEWQRIKGGWVAYITTVRRQLEENPGRKLKTILEQEGGLHSGVSKARSWTIERWEDGYKRIFAPTEIVETGGAVETESIEEDDEYDSDTDSDE